MNMEPSAVWPSLLLIAVISLSSYVAAMLAFLTLEFARSHPISLRRSGLSWGRTDRAGEARLRELAEPREPTILSEVREILHDQHQCRCQPSRCLWAGPDACPTPWMHHQTECPVWQGLGMGIS